MDGTPHHAHIFFRGIPQSTEKLLQSFLKAIEIVIDGLRFSNLRLSPEGHLCWFVGYGLMSHSAIFQLYSDGTVVQFSKF